MPRLLAGGYREIDDQHPIHSSMSFYSIDTQRLIDNLLYIDCCRLLLSLGKHGYRWCLSKNFSTIACDDDQADLTICRLPLLRIWGISRDLNNAYRGR